MNPNKQTLTSLESILYDAFMCAEEPEDVDFFAQHLAKNPDSCALELGCGSGRVLLELVANGHQVEGLDCDEQMLTQAQNRAQDLGITLKLHHGRMEEFKPQKQYQTLYSPGFSFQLLHEKTQALNALQSWKNWLLPKGEILLTCYWPWEADEGIEQTNWELYNTLEGEYLHQWLALAHHPHTEKAASARCLTKAKINHQTQQITRYHRYELLDKQERILDEDQSALKQRYWQPQELESAAKQAGYSQTKIYSGFSQHPLEQGDNLWTIVLS